MAHHVLERTDHLNGMTGACQRLECVHNADLMCTAEGVDISDSAACLTYQAR